MKDRIISALQNEFQDFKVTHESDEEKGTVTISAVKDAKTGFEIDIKRGEKEVNISYVSKIRTIATLTVLAVTIVLTVVFGRSILSAIGLVMKTSYSTVTLKLFYIVPLLIFLIPGMIISSLVTAKLNPKDMKLLERVRVTIANTGAEAIIL